MLGARALHVQSRSVPTTEYYRRSIGVCVVPVPARDTNKARLVLATPFVHGSTDRACLRTEGRVNFNQLKHLITK